MTNIRSKGHTPHAFAARAATFSALIVACTNTPPPTAPCPPAPAAESAEASTEGAASKAAAAPRRFVISRSEITEMTSEETGRQYEISVAVPESYAKEPDRRYPVVYLLDGQWDFPLFLTMAGGLRYDNGNPRSLHRRDHVRRRKSRLQQTPNRRLHPDPLQRALGTRAARR
jgi:putative esterase